MSRVAAIMESVRAFADLEADRRAREFASSSGAEYADGEVSMTNELSEAEYGTPDTEASPWMMATLEGLRHGG